jgi:hypothetical protein
MSYLLCRKTARQMIGCHRIAMAGIRGALELSLGTCSQSSFSHQACHSLARAGKSLISELALYTRTTVAVPMLLENGANLHFQLSILLRSPTLGSSSPSVVAADGNVQYPALQSNGMLMAMLFNEGVSHRSWGAKILTAFFNTSRS